MPSPDHRPPAFFDLDPQQPAKAAPELIAGDAARFSAVASATERSLSVLRERLARLEATPARAGREAAERDAEIRGLYARIGLLSRRSADLCLGRMTPADGGEPVYIGRLGVLGEDGEPLLIDWRTPAAEPFFAATVAEPRGLVSRRRYRWTGGRVVDYWDEALTADATGAALDPQSSFLAGLGAARTTEMRDVLATLAADQDAIVRASSRGALVADGGPGTGKTVVALHRAAYLLYADPAVSSARGGILFIGPHQPYLNYVAGVLPDLGEEGTAFATLADLVPEGAVAVPEPDPAVSALKSTTVLIDAIAPAVRFYQQPPTEPLTVQTEIAQVTVPAAVWAQAFEAVEPGTPHNEARQVVWDELLELLTDGQTPEIAALLRRAIVAEGSIRKELRRAWPLIEPGQLVGDLFSVPAYLAMAAPQLSAEQVALVQRRDPQAWTVDDLPLLDTARRLLGDPQYERLLARRRREEARRRAGMSRVIDDLLAGDDDGEGLVQQFAGGGLAELTVDQNALAQAGHDRLAGSFAHVIVDEAQELTPAQWQMLRSRCPSGGFTVVGDRAQARAGFPESWEDRLSAAGLRQIRVSGLHLNYRTPEEVMTVAAGQIRTALPDANIPESVRRSGIPVRYGRREELDAVLHDWLASHDGVAAVIGVGADPGLDRVTALSPEMTSGLEFDLVVVDDPAAFGTGLPGAVARYIAFTRTTGELVVLG